MIDTYTCDDRQRREAAENTLRRAGEALLQWLLSAAYPLWASQGFDKLHGGFHESLDSEARPAYEPRRIRVQLRQIYAFALAPSLGWGAATEGLVADGLEYVRRHYRRPDGLYRSVVTPEGASIDDRAFLYDQAFVLLALAESQRVLGRQPNLVAEATTLRHTLCARLKRSGAGFRSGDSEPLPLLANPHMHLLEAALRWTEISDDPGWWKLADEIVTLALHTFIDARTGALRERFAADWTPIGPEAGPVVEPGHQFEWAWLLLRWSHNAAGDAVSSARRLIEIGEAHGVRGNVAVNALTEDLEVSDGAARLWPQTERVKASVCLAKRIQDARLWLQATSAVAALSRFLSTPMPGLWHDRLTPDGEFVPVVPPRSPASSFYHIVCAIAELTMPTVRAPTPLHIAGPSSRITGPPETELQTRDPRLLRRSRCNRVQ